MITIIACVVTAVIVMLITRLVTSKMIERNNNITLSNANQKAEKIIEEAKVLASNYKKEAELVAKEDALRFKKEMELEIKEQRNEVQKYEKRIITKEEALDKKIDLIDQKENAITKKEVEIENIKNEILSLKQEQEHSLEKIAELTKEEAKTKIMTDLRAELVDERAKLIKSFEIQAKEEADKKAKEIILSSIARCNVDHISEATISTVELASDDMKGRIIGREGRNIRTFETITGVELIIDDTPEAVVLSCFNPIRRQIAKIALEKLLLDGRIHPTRIEETVESARKELETTIKEIGEETILDLGLHGIHPEIVKLIGRMNYRTSYSQNALKHSIEVAKLAGILAAEFGEDVALAKRAGLLHDIGKAIDFELEGSHVQIGSEICRKYNEAYEVINSVESHHGDVEADTVISVLVSCADMISAARPGARREDLEVYINRLKRLEEISNSYEGVEKSFAIQAGREVRIMVVPEEISDANAVILSREIAKQIEDELQYPGQIKVSVIRETRATTYAK